MRTRAIKVTEVAARDGLQSIVGVLPTAKKVALVKRLLRSGVRHFDVASFVHPKLVPQLSDGLQVCQSLLDDEDALMRDVDMTAIVPNMKGLRTVLPLLSDKRLSASLWVHPSLAFSMRNLKTTPEEQTQECLRMADLLMSKGARYRFYISGIVCPVTGEVVSSERVQQLVSLFPDASDIVLADTVGRVGPALLENLLDGFCSKERLGLHLHNTFGLALVNIYLAISKGVRAFESSVGGLGGCPFAGGATGNVATEDLVHLLESMGERSGINVESLIETGLWVSNELGVAPDSMLARAYQRTKRIESGH